MSVHPQADSQIFLMRFQMNVTCTFQNSTFHDDVDQPDRGSFRYGTVLNTHGDKDRFRRKIVFFVCRFTLHIRNGFCGTVVAVENLYGASHSGTGCNHGYYVFMGKYAHILKGVKIHGVTHGKEQFISAYAHGNRFIAHGKCFGEYLCHFHRNMHS